MMARVYTLDDGRTIYSGRFLMVQHFTEISSDEIYHLPDHASLVTPPFNLLADQSVKSMKICSYGIPIYSSMMSFCFAFHITLHIDLNLLIPVCLNH